MTNRKLQKLLSLLTVLALCLGMVPAAAAESFYEEGVYEESSYWEPAYEEYVYEEPAYEEPAYEEPVYEEADFAPPEESGPVAVRFLPEPAEAEITVFDPARTGEFGEMLALEPDEDSTYWLMPGEYLVDVVCEGYESFLAVPLTVENEALTLPVVMTPVEAAEPAAEEPDVEEPADELLVVEEPADEEIVAEEPVDEEPTDEAPIVEALIAEEPVAAEDAVEEPAAEAEIAANGEDDMKPHIINHPVSTTVDAGGTAIFSVFAVGSGSVHYQWQFKSGNTWKNIGSGGTCKGYDTEQLSVPAAGHENMEFRCYIWNNLGYEESDSAKLTVRPSATVPKPVISKNPVDATVAAGGTASFTVTASGTGLTYRWQYLSGGVWKNIGTTGSCTGVTTATLKVPAAGHENMQFRCAVKNSGGTVYSGAATLKIKSAPVAKPVIRKSPVDAAVSAGGTASFTVTAGGTGLTYRWQFKSGSTWKNISTTGSCTGVTTATLKVPAAGHENMEFRCAVTNGGGTVYSGSAKLTVKAAPVAKPVITGQPANAEVEAGGTATFTVTASGTGLTYQWQYLSGTAWKNISTTGSCTGATTATLQVPAAGHENMEFRCAVKNGGGTVYSGTAKLTVKAAPVAPPVITKHPEPATVSTGGTGVFTVEASGENLTYQWQYLSGTTWKNVTGGSCTGYKTKTLSVPAAGHNNMQFKCMVKNDGGEVFSQPAKLTVLSGVPTITKHPENAAVDPDETGSFTVTASGTGLSYQWQVLAGSVWMDITADDCLEGYNTPTLRVPAYGNADVQFRCKVSNSAGDVFSNPATLLVRPKITQNPTDCTVGAGETGTFTVEASGTGLSYQWQFLSGTTWKNVSEGACTGTATPTLRVPSAGRANMQFRCRVTNSAGSAESEAASLLVMPKITVQPANATVNPGATATFTVTASGTGLTYQWQVLTGGEWVDIAGQGYSGYATRTLQVLAEGHADMQYRCRVSNNAGTVESDPATLLVRPAITQHPANATVNTDETASFTVAASGTNLSYQWQRKSGTAWVDLTASDGCTGFDSPTLQVPALSYAGTQFRCAVINAADTVYSNPATLLVKPKITTQPSDAAVNSDESASFTVEALGSGLSYQWQYLSGTSWKNITGGSCTGYNTATMTVPAAGHVDMQFRCRVWNTAGSVESEAATLLVKPAITRHPADAKVSAYETASFTVAASGTNLTYQWQRLSGSSWVNLTASDGTGFDGPTLSVPAAGRADMQVRCVVTNRAGSAESNPATLLVKPQITRDPADAAVNAGAAASFTVAASGTNLTYQWQHLTASGWVDIVASDGCSNYTTPTLSVPSTDFAGEQFRCRVTNAAGSVTSAAAKLHVKPKITQNPVNATVDAGATGSFTVEAIGTDLQYQWQRKSGSSWVDLTASDGCTGYNTATLKVPAAGHEGMQFRCVVSNSVGSAESGAATLLVRPGITQHPRNVTVKADQTASFTVEASGTGLSYQWQLLSDGSWVDIVPESGCTGYDSPTLQVPAASYAGLQFRCAVTNTAGTTNSNPATLSVKPAITQHPANAAVNSGEDGSFTVTALGPGLSYQWQYLSGSTWKDIGPGSCTGYNTPTLTVPSAGHSNMQFRCVVSNSLGSDTSNPAVLSVIGVTNYRALLIGERNFLWENGVRETADRNEGDVTRMANMLNAIQGPEGGRYSITQMINLNNQGVSDAIGEIFAGADEDDVSLIFIATHGVTNIESGREAGMLVTTDGEHMVEYLALEDLASWLSAVPGKVIVLLGSCGSGAAVLPPDGIDANSVRGDDSAAFTESVVQTFSMYDRRTARFVPNTGEFRVDNKFYVLTAARHMESSWGTEGGPYNFFTYHLTRGVTLSGMPADKDKDGSVSLDEAYLYIVAYATGPYNDGTGNYYQHVQAYPMNSDYKLFTRLN